MLLAFLAIVGGLVVLIWSADRFIDGAAATAGHAGMPALLIGMLVVGFGTSAPEMVVSAFAAAGGSPQLALGNAYGSNIVNISLILGATALVTPIAIHSGLIRKELPLLVLLVLFSGWQLLDGKLSRPDAIVLLAGFFALLGWSLLSALRHNGNDPLAQDMHREIHEHTMPLPQALFWLLLGLLLLVASSRLLVWGAITVAQQLGISDMIIGLTIVALGTSLPELAASVTAVRKGQHDIALGNVLGSNMFNLLAVVGIAGAIAPLDVLQETLARDWPVMMALTIALFAMCFRPAGEGHIHRWQGVLLLAAYVGYNGWLAWQLTG